MAGLFKRTLVAVAGVVLGVAAVAVVSGFGLLRHALAKDDVPAASPHVQGKPAPDDRV